MRLRRRAIGGEPVAEMHDGEVWRLLSGDRRTEELLAAHDIDAVTDDLLPYLQLGPEGNAALSELGPSLPEADARDGAPLLPVVPKSFRDFMLYEAHVIATSRSMVKRFLPRLFPITQVYERLTGRVFPKFRPHPLWYRQPIYYLGNHLNMATDGETVIWPHYSDVLDYELEIGAILARPLRNASAKEAERAIGGFVVLNDFSARDVQIDEMQSGFGPQKAKHFGSAISAEIVTADEILPGLDSLTGSVAINGTEVASVSAAGSKFTLADAIAFASQGENLVPGELFGSGTLPGGTGMENGRLLAPGDRITLSLSGIGSLTNVIAGKEDQPG